MTKWLRPVYTQLEINARALVEAERGQRITSFLSTQGRPLILLDFKFVKYEIKFGLRDI